MVVQVKFQSLIGDANCVNSGIPPPKCLVRSLEDISIIDNSVVQTSFVIPMHPTGTTD